MAWAPPNWGVWGAAATSLALLKEKIYFNTFFKNFEERGIDIKKIFSVITDGTPAMMRQHSRFVALVEQKFGHPVMELHCIIHQENLCGKISNSALYDEMSIVTKIVTFLVARSTTTHRQFRSLLKDGKCIP